MKKDNYQKFLLLMLALMLPATAAAYDFEVDGIYYNINGNEVTVTYRNLPNNSYSGDITIPNIITYNNSTYTVSSIGNQAFSDCPGLTSVTIPKTITSIGQHVFLRCSRLTNLKVAYDNSNYDSRGNCNAIIETSSNKLMYGCQNTVIPNSVTSIGPSAFYGCSFMETITIPNSVTTIGLWAFRNCSTITSMTIPNSVTSIGDGAFDSCTNLINITIGNSVSSIGYEAFRNCTSLISVVLPNSVTHIGHSVFYNCRNLTSIELSKSVEEISFDFFYNCSSLTSITIPNSVTTIGVRAFYGCTGLTSINVESGNTVYDSRDNCNAIIKTSDNTLIVGCQNTIIPNSVTTIGNSAFSDCYGLSNIVIPNSVTEIGEASFSGCTGMSSIDIGNSVTCIGSDAFISCDKLKNVYCYAVNPPTCFDSTFEIYSATLHVPAASLAAYFIAPSWSNFENIIGDAVPPSGIIISRESAIIQLGEQLELMATVIPANASNKNVVWYSTNLNIATVDNGTVTAVGIGECDIIAKCFEMQDTCHISITNPIILDQQEVMLLPNHLLVLTPSAPVMPSGFTVTSSDPTVAAARVMNGKVQIVGIKEGTTTITVASTDGTAQPATCLVTVYTESGDLNSDGFVDISDVTSLIDYLFGGNETSVATKNADVNSDGKIDIDDVTSLIDTLLSETE